MKTILILALCLFPTLLFASPFLVCDPQTGVTQYTIEVKQGTAVIETATFAAQADGSGKWDLAKYAVGSYSFRLKAADAKGWWSDFSVPFDATKGVVPGNVRITP
jgi:hypothetical protein